MVLFRTGKDCLDALEKLVWEGRLFVIHYRDRVNTFRLLGITLLISPPH